MKIVFITPASWLRRQRFYRLGGSFYGHTNAITGPLILGHILKTAGIQHLRLSTEAGNVKAQRLYTDIGFMKLDELDGDDLVFGLSISHDI